MTIIKIALTVIFLLPGLNWADVVPMEKILKLKNDKETRITTMSKKDIESTIALYKDDEYSKISDIFFRTMYQFVNISESQCEMHFIDLFIASVKLNDIKSDRESISAHFKILRINNDIDDLLLDILLDSAHDYYELTKRTDKKARKSLKSFKKTLANNDLADLYSNFQEFPDEINQCVYREFIHIKNMIKNKKDKKAKRPYTILKTLNKKAYEEKLISLESYNKLQYLTNDSRVTRKYIWLRDYLTVIFNAKNQLVPISSTYQSLDLNDEDEFASKILKRRTSLTQRELLYRKYNETQIILLAQVLQKASRRMGVDQDTISQAPVISQEFSILQTNGERETYVEKIELDPQSQFNLARRLLRKDILELQMMDTFNGLEISFNDVVMAAFETGYISIEDINYVVKYDDLWNPTISKYQRAKGFIVRVAGYSTFFLPPPWNVLSTIAIGIIDTVIDNRFFSNGAENDNPATFIE